MQVEFCRRQINGRGWTKVFHEVTFDGRPTDFVAFENDDGSITVENDSAGILALEFASLDAVRAHFG